MDKIKVLALSAAACTVLGGAARAGITYKTVEELTSPQQSTMKLDVQVSGGNSRSEMSLSNLGSMGGSTADQTAKAQDAVHGVEDAQAQMMKTQMAQMNQYLDMIKDPKKKEEMRQKMAMMQAQMGGAQAQAANKANDDVIAKGAQNTTSALAGNTMYSLIDLKAKTAVRYMDMPGHKEYDQKNLVAAAKSGNGWETSAASLKQDEPKEEDNDTLYVLHLKWTLTHAASKETSEFSGDIRYWMDASKEKELGAQWRAYSTARRKGGIGGISMRENMDTALYYINTDAVRGQFDKALAAMPGIPLKIEYDLKGKGLKYRLAGIMKAMASGDTGSDLADATDDASSGAPETPAAAGPADDQAEKPWHLTVTMADMKPAEPPATAFIVPEGYTKK